VEDHAASLPSHYAAILRFVRRRLESPVQAEDIAQEAFASAAAFLADSRNTAPPTLGWLYTVARRRIIDESRRRRPATVPLESASDTTASSGEYGGRVADVLRAALADLTETQRVVVVMRLLEGRSFSEIGEQVGATEQACRVRFMRGLEHVREHFEEEGLTP
jgi:RNA polymerase sigma-70 factor (ECF subfamily)